MTLVLASATETTGYVLAGIFRYGGLDATTLANEMIGRFCDDDDCVSSERRRNLFSGRDPLALSKRTSRPSGRNFRLDYCLAAATSGKASHGSRLFVPLHGKWMSMARILVFSHRDSGSVIRTRSAVFTFKVQGRNHCHAYKHREHRAPSRSDYGWILVTLKCWKVRAVTWSRVVQTKSARNGSTSPHSFGPEACARTRCRKMRQQEPTTA
jgi:hypothetical protein